jgi:DNA-binding NarL/FixJ family response regulator
MARTPIRILIADDHAIVRSGLKTLIDDMPGMSVVAEVTNGAEVLEYLRSHQVDIAILDLTMPERSGLDVLLHIKTECPQVRVLVFSLHSEEQYGRRLLRAGAYGYLSKSCAPKLLEEALWSIAEGRKFVTPSLAEHLAAELIGPQSAPPHASLTDREYEILLLVAQGFRLQDIAQRLSLGSATIRSYRLKILRKLNVRTTAGLIRYAIVHHLLDNPLVSK